VGEVLAVKVCESEAVQPSASVTVTVYVAEELTLMHEDVALVDHEYEEKVPEAQS
jgi:hypothetical protein